MENFFSIIIPTCNRNAQLALCLDRLAPGSQTLPAHNYEVIVTDDSPDAAAEVFCHQHYPWVRYYRGPMQGPAANRNHGSRHANAPWLVFTDDDCLPDSKWLEAYSKAITQYPESLAFEGAILPDNPELLKKDLAECPVNEQGGCFWSANIMIAVSLFKKVGGFDEQFKFAAQEDQDLALRLKVISNIVFFASAIVIHPVRISSIKSKLRYAVPRFNNWLIFASRKTGKSKRFLLVKAGIDLQKRALALLLSGKPKSAVVSGYKSLVAFGLVFLPQES